MGRKLKELRAEIADLRDEVTKLWKALGKKELKPGKPPKHGKKAAAKKAPPKKPVKKSAKKREAALAEPDPIAAAIEATEQ